MNLRVLLIVCVAWLSLCSGKAQLISTHNVLADRGYLNVYTYGIFKDSREYLWIGTRDGLHRFDGYSLDTYHTNVADSHSLGNDMVNWIEEDDNGYIWIGTLDGLYRMHLDTPGRFQQIFLPVSPEVDVNEQRVNSIIKGPDGIFWLATSHHGFYRFDPRTLKAEGFLPWDYYPHLKTESRFNSMRESLLDSAYDNKLWIGGVAGLVEFDYGQKSMELHTMDVHYGSGGTSVFCQTRMEDGTLWLGTWSGGLLQYDPNTKEIRQFLFHYDKARDQGGINVVHDMVFQKPDHIWIATTDKGLGVFDRTTETFTFFADPSVPTNICYKLMMDEYGFLWSTYREGVLVSELEHSKRPNRPTKVIVSSFEVDGEAQPIERHSGLQLDPGGQDLVFTLSDFNYYPATQSEFSYLLEGHDHAWQTSQDNHVYYTDVSGGQYTFQVRARWDGGPWSDVSALSFSVPVRLWNRAWFFPAVTALILLMFFGVYLWRQRRRREREELQSEFERVLAEVEMKALRAQMNPHFLFNSLNSINNYILKSDQKGASEYLTKFSWLMRLILQNSKEKTVSLARELEALELYVELEAQRLSGKFTYSFVVANNIDLKQIRIPPLILQPYVENAIWHGLMNKHNQGHLLIEVKEKGEQIICIIEDNGIGREKAMTLKSRSSSKKESMGLQITNHRIDLAKKLLNIDSKVIITDLQSEEGETLGTRVEIVIPITQNELI